MRIRLVTSVSVRKWKSPFASKRYAGIWQEIRQKALALALPRNRDRCPKCGSKDFRRSRRKNFIEFGISRFVLPYRCPHCYLRFFRAVEGDAEDPRHYRAHYTELQQVHRTP
jgi:hypothetical protein